MKKPLTKTENEVLKLLSRGVNYQRVAHLLEMKLASVHTHCCVIRKKTGIADTRNPVECSRWLDPRPQSAVEKTPTATQLKVMRMLASGHNYLEISERLGMRFQTAQNHAFVGCKRAKIKKAGHRRSVEIRAYLEQIDSAVSLNLDDY